MDEQRATKIWLQKQLKTNGVQCQREALERLINVVQNVPDPEDFVHNLLEELGTVTEDHKLSLEVLEEIINIIDGRAEPQNIIQIVNAADVPYIVYDPVRRLFHRSNEPRRIFGDAKSKIDLYINRYQLILQRLRRNKLFRSATFASLEQGKGQAECELTELKAMLGVVGELRTVAGFLTQPEEGRFALEDLSARVPIDLSEAEKTHGLFTENSVVVAEGVLQSNGVFKVAALGLPPAEPRAESQKALQGLDFFGCQPADERGLLEWQAQHPEDRVIFLSDCWLDRPDVIAHMHTILQGYNELEQPPSLFVLAGDFQSYNANGVGTRYNKLQDNFLALGRLLNQYEKLKGQSKFLLVPGPGDLGPGPVLPRPPLIQAILKDLAHTNPNIILGSNPCRIRHGNSDILVFRDNIQHKLQSLAALSLPADDDVPLFEHVCATVLQQAHLSPVPLEFQPIYWEFDHALYAYPLPDALVLADNTPSASHSFDTCSCINPGKLSSGTFAAFNPVTQETELCDVSAAMELEDNSEKCLT